MEFHPIADLFRLMTDREFADFCIDIAANGLLEPIWTFKHEGEPKIIDGRNRFNACTRVGVEPQYRAWQGEEGELISFVVSLNLNRRHLNESERAMIAAQLVNTKQGERRDLSAIADKLSQADAARLLNVSCDSVGRGVKVKEKGIPELVKLVEAGDMSVTKGAVIAGMSKKKQRRVIESGRNAGKRMLNRLKARALRKTEDGYVGCLHCSPVAKFDEEHISAFGQKVAYRAAAYAKKHGARNYAPIFEAMSEEIAEMAISDLVLEHRDMVIAAIDSGAEDGDLGVIEEQDLLRITKIPKVVFEKVMGNLIDYNEVDVYRQGRVTEGQRGATKTLYRRRVQVEEPGLVVEYDDDARIFDPFDI